MKMITASLVILSLIAVCSAYENLAGNSGVTCQASSQYTSAYACENAYNGKLDPDSPRSEWASDGEASGASITINLGKLSLVQELRLWFRCYIHDQNSRYVIEFSNGKTITKQRVCNGGNEYNQCSTVPVEIVQVGVQKTDFVKITAYDACAVGETDNAGLREVEIWGIYVETGCVDTIGPCSKTCGIGNYDVKTWCNGENTETESKSCCVTPCPSGGTGQYQGNKCMDHPPFNGGVMD